VRLSPRSLAGLGIAAAGLTLAAVPSTRHTPRFEGEFGLYAQIVDGGLQVRWITQEASQGLIYAYVDGDQIQRVTTSASQTHGARIETPAPVVDLLYGAEDGAMYRTTIELTPPARPRLEIDGVDSVYIFGDVHGEFDHVVLLLGNAGLIDDDLAWSGGSRHVVFLGDLFDRGDDVTRVLWFLYGLERQAAQAGGAVHVVLGNHELMAMSGDLRYVSGKETMLAQAHGIDYSTMFDPKESVLGRWLASKPGVVRMGDLLLAHGGMSPAYVGYTLQQYEDSLAAFMGEELFVHWNDPEYLAEFSKATRLDSAAVARRYDFFFGTQSVQWYRALIYSDTLGGFLDTVLSNFHVSTHIIGHTPVPTIGERYEGRLIATDLEDAASEMLFLARRPDGGWDRYMIPLFGAPQRLGSLMSADTGVDP